MCRVAPVQLTFAFEKLKSIRSLGTLRARMKAIAVNHNKREVGLINHPTPEISLPTEVKFRTLKSAFAAQTAKSADSIMAIRRRALSISCWDTKLSAT